jgi:DNA-binding NarL/FixJ family response regulator
MMTNQIRVLLADDHVLVRQGVRRILEVSGDIVVIAETDNGAEAISLAKELHPDVAVLDIRMPEVTGVEAARKIKLQNPEIKVLMLTAFDDDPYVFALLQAGADGYVLKTSSSEDLVKAVRMVATGKSVLSPEITSKLMQSVMQKSSTPLSKGVAMLSSREIEVMHLTARGLTNREIGRELGISHRTVQGHLANVYDKLNVKGRTEAVTEALKRGWITID